MSTKTAPAKFGGKNLPIGGVIICLLLNGVNYVYILCTIYTDNLFALSLVIGVDILCSFTLVGTKAAKRKHFLTQKYKTDLTKLVAKHNEEFGKNVDIRSLYQTYRNSDICTETFKVDLYCLIQRSREEIQQVQDSVFRIQKHISEDLAVLEQLHSVPQFISIDAWKALMRSKSRSLRRLQEELNKYFPDNVQS
jgi:hypothetical protein